MRKAALMVALSVATLGLAGSALAHGDPVEGPGGSTKTGGQVTCGTTTKPGRIGPVHLYNNGKGAEVCSDSGLIQGRASLGSSPHLGPLELPDYILVEGDDDSAVPGPNAHIHLILNYPAIPVP